MQTQPEQLFVCSVVKAELFYGAAKSQHPERTRQSQHLFLQPFRSLDFDDRSAEHYATIRAELERQGTPIGPNDLMIAAIALANELTLVTANQSEFSRVPGLIQECWESQSNV